MLHCSRSDFLLSTLSGISQEKNIKHTGNISFDDILAIAKIMRPRSCARNIGGTVKEMLGTAVSVGCTVDRQHPNDICEKVRK